MKVESAESFPDRQRSPVASPRSPLIYALAAIMTGYGLAAQRWHADVDLLWLLGLTLSVAAVLGLRFTRSRVLWVVLYLPACALLAWAYAQLRAPVELEEWKVLPPREVNLSLRVWRAFDTDDRYGRIGGLATVVNAPRHLNELLGQRVVYQLMPGDATEHYRSLEFLARGEWIHREQAQIEADFAQYLREHGVAFSLKRGRVLTVTDTGNPLYRLCMRLNARLTEVLLMGTQEHRAHGVLAALVLGKKSLLSDAQEERFVASGTMHFFAISGLHVGIVAAFLYWVFARLGANGVIAALVGLLLVYGYVEITGGTPSAMRAFTMVAFVWLARACLRQPVAMPALVASAVFVLLVEPTQLWSPGFQLSYAVVGAILLFGAPTAERWIRYYHPERWLPDNCGLTRHHVQGWLGRTMGAAAIVSFTATMVSAPLIAAYFGVWTPGAVFLNIVLFPLVGVVLVGGLLSALFGMLLPVIAVLMNRILVELIGLMGSFLGVALEVPGFFVQEVIFGRNAGLAGTLFILFVMAFSQSEAVVCRARLHVVLPLVAVFVVQCVIVM